MGFSNRISRRQYLEMSLTTALAFSHSGSEFDNPLETSASAYLSDETSRADPTEPYIVAGEGTPFFEGSQGWETVPATERKRTILNLHPDKLQSSKGVTNPPRPIEENVRGGTGQVRTFGQQTGISIESQNLYPYIVGDSSNTWYSDLPDEEKFRSPDGDLIKDLYETAAKQTNGKRNVFQFDGIDHIVPSHHIPDVRNRDSEVISAFVAAGFSDFYFDAISRIEQVDVSDYAATVFQNYLAGLPSNRLSELGIDDPTNFDISKHIETTEIANPAENNVIREFVLFHFRTAQEYMSRVTSSVHEEFPDRKLNLMANLGSPEFLISVHFSDAFDTIIWEDIFTVPPVRYRDFTYKLGRAIGRFDKPAIGAGNLQNIDGSDTTAGLDSSERYPSLLRIQAGEAYANGGIRTAPMTGWPISPIDSVVDNWVLEDGSVPEELQTFIDFVWANQRFIREDESRNDVAVVYSYPTFLWQSQHSLWGGSRRPTQSFRGAIDICREHQIPCDAAVFGHPELWSDNDQLDRLDRYEVIFLPGIECVSDPQANRLESLLNSGTTVVATGGPPKRTESWEERSDIAELLSTHDNAYVFDDDLAAAYFNGSRADSLVETIRSVRNQVRLDTDAHVGVNVRAKEGHRIIHLVNYEYEPESDSVDSTEALQINVQLPFEPTSARWVSPQSTESVETGTDGVYTTVSVPRLAEWGFVVFADGDENLLERGTEREATNSHDAAESIIEQRRSAGHEVGLVEAEVTLRESNLAREYGDFELAKRRAQRASNLGERAVKPPVVGFDQAHGQAEQGYEYNTFENMRTFFDEFSYRAVEQWSSETFEELDLLIIPPVKAGEPPEFGATDKEISRLESFVEGGGRLLWMGAPGMAEDTNDIISKFGFEFSTEAVVNPERSDQVRNLRGIQELSHPSAGRQHIRVRYGTSLSVSEDVEVFAWYPEDTPGVTNESRSNVAGDPIMGTATFGEGVVAVTAASNHFYQLRSVRGYPEWLSDWETLFNILWRLATPTDVGYPPSISPQETTNSSTNTTTVANSTGVGDSNKGGTATGSADSSSGQAPGFGILEGLASLSVGGYLLKRRLDTNDDE